MTSEVTSSARHILRWRRTPVTAMGLGGAVILAVLGVALSRPDVAAIGLPLALSTTWMLVRRPAPAHLDVDLRAHGGDLLTSQEVRGAVDVAVVADWVQLAVDQGGRRSGLADVRPGPASVLSRARLQHSGPHEVLAVTARAVTLDGAWATEVAPRVELVWNASPRTRRVSRLPIAPRLTGLLGVHESGRPGQGGDFRDIHPFAPGDELRRVDWRATARAARRPGELLVRRNNALSESSVVIAMDTAEDLGTAVASWGTGDADRTGVTSLDLAREAALAVATAAVAGGDRVAYHVLAPGGRSLPAGGGARHLARVRDVIAATGLGADESRYRRSPAVSPGSIVFVLSTFFDGVAAELATRWRAAGHAVVAVDVLPEPDATRLTREQSIAMRTLLAERSDILGELVRAGVEVVPWSGGDPDIALRIAARRQQRRRAGR